jgi:hypothetical protein
MKMRKEKGLLTVWIDKITPCLIDTETGEEAETVAFRIDRRQLKGYNKKTGWYVNWAAMPDECEIYALALKKNQEIQGLIAVVNDSDIGLLYLHWACTAPHNNKQLNRKKRYEGVGGHLFAIAAEKSEEWGYEGNMHGFAASEELELHYIDTLGAKHVGRLHPYQIHIDEEGAKRIRETYKYEWL